jgi:hypothetical protein
MRNRISEKYHAGENLAKNVVMIDGITRSGKSVLSHVIGTFENTEHIQFYMPLEHLMSGVALGSVEVDFARAFLRSQLNELTCNSMLGRNVNFRATDQTGVPNHPRFEMYKARLEQSEGDNIVELLRGGKNLFPFLTHDIMVNYEIFESLLPEAKVIEIYRNPVLNIRSCYLKGYGARFSNDPRFFTLTLSEGFEPVPWYAESQESLWRSFNNMERCVWMVTHLIRKSISEQRLSHSNLVLTISHEHLVQETDKIVDRIETFIGQKRTAATSIQLLKQECPRKIDTNIEKQFLRDIRSSTRKSLVTDLESLVEDFNDNVYGFCNE